MLSGEHMLLYSLLSSLSLALSSELKTVTLQDLLNVNLSEYTEGSEAALLFIIPENCSDCHVHSKLLNDIASDVMYSGDIFHLNDIYIPWINLLSAPAILFLNNERKIPYLGPLHRTHLVNAMHQFITGVQSARLDDANFEHDTQASTGSTTGNWLVIFDDITADTLQMYDGLSLTLRAKHVNIGVLDPKISTRTAKRFNMSIPLQTTQNNPRISAILLKQSVMYQYSKNLYRMDYEKILQFALTDYTDHIKGLIPRPRMIFDEVVDSLVEFTVNLQNEFGKPLVLLLSVIALFTVMIFIGLVLIVGFWFAGSFENDDKHVPVATITSQTKDDRSKSLAKSKCE
ncbi:Thioredoxin domain-containing protein isoform 1 [Schistosoma japonicum]|uniref:Thioredoxin domain-containing protein isoform 1 n=1 Tax=Schistosoma japonicum TaxID=6182 RepID=A0A4Z2DT09_SCHJA|nr:Thioredoxin domain-containing protein isoform 1 [Schistosoma japonicum]